MINTSKSGLKNELILLGMIHSGHYEHKSYSLRVLREIIEKVNPDLILAEILPGRFIKAMEDWKENKFILDSRVNQFPEYSEVIIPLSESMKFEIIPTSAWTEGMSILREKKLDEIHQNSARLGRR